MFQIIQNFRISSSRSTKPAWKFKVIGELIGNSPQWTKNLPYFRGYTENDQAFIIWLQPTFSTLTTKSFIQLYCQVRLFFLEFSIYIILILADNILLPKKFRFNKNMNYEGIQIPSFLDLPSSIYLDLCVLAVNSRNW